MNRFKSFILCIESVILIFFLAVLLFCVVGKIFGIQILSFFAFLVAYDFPGFLNSIFGYIGSVIVYFVLLSIIPIIGFIRFREYYLRHFLYLVALLVMIAYYLFIYFSLKYLWFNKMKYLYSFLAAWGLGTISLNIAFSWVSDTTYISLFDIGASVLFGAIPGFFIFVLTLPFLIWVKKYRIAFIAVADFIGFLFSIVFIAALLDTIASVWFCFV